MGVMDPASSPKARATVNMFTEELLGAASPKANASAHQALSADDIEMFSAAFSKFDADGSGTINASELETLLQTMGQHQSEDQLGAMMKEADSSGDGEIDCDEFMNLMGKHVGSQADVMEGDLRYAFDALDADCSGTISAAELKTAASTLGDKLSTAEVDAMLALVDNDGSGEIDFEEFCTCARLPAPDATAPSASPTPPSAPEFSQDVLRRKFRSVLRMLVLQRRMTDAFSKFSSDAYQWQRFTDIEKVSSVAATIVHPIESISANATVAEALDTLRTTAGACLPVVADDGTVVGFATIFDVLRFVAEQLISQFTVQIDFVQRDVAHQSLHGAQHLERAWCQAEKSKVNMASDVLRARLLKLTTTGSVLHTTTIAEIVDKNVRPVRPGFSVSDVSDQLSQAPTHRVPLVDWDGKPMALISQLSILEALAEPGQREARVGPAADLDAEEISEEVTVVPSFSMALSAFHLLQPEADGSRAVPAVAVVDEGTGVLLGEVSIDSLRVSPTEAKNGLAGLSTLSLPLVSFLALRHRAVPTCRADTPLHEVLDTAIRSHSDHVWLVDAEGRPRGIVTATAILGAICRGGK